LQDAYSNKLAFANKWIFGRKTNTFSYMIIDNTRNKLSNCNNIEEENQQGTNKGRKEDAKQSSQIR
jgi:hypothetical protein